MRARYLGDHDNFAAWGIRFPIGVFVEVTDPHAQKKIAGNREFEVQNADAEEVSFVETPRAPKVEPLVMAQSFDDLPALSEVPDYTQVDAVPDDDAPAVEPRVKRPYNKKHK